MNERQLRALIEAVRKGRVTRRNFIATLAGVGLTAPLASQLLMHAGIAQAQTPFAYKPAKRGGGGALKALWWQGATLLNPHFATGTKDASGSRIFYEPLAAWDSEANLVPVLAAEIPTLENGGVSRDGKSVAWKLKRNVLWHDGKPFTSADVVFNWEYAADPATASVNISAYSDLKVVAADLYTVRIEFNNPTPFWANAFVANAGMLIPKHLFDGYRGAKSREAPTNLKPVGTGPYRFVDFTPGDTVRGALNPNYHQPNRPYFDTIEMKGGGDAVSAARAVLQTGEYDYAWNLLVEDEVLLRLENGGKGKVTIVPGGAIEFIQFNFTDPWTDVDGERSSVRTKHPTLSDPAVREAFAHLIDRGAIQQYIYGRTGIATVNFVNNPSRFVSKNNQFEFNVDKANQLLENAGWKRGADGIRAKDGNKLKFVFQTSVNQPRQKTQAIIKQACQKAGIELELKSVTASVYFSSDIGNPDVNTKFYSDIQMYNLGMGAPDPRGLMRQFCSWEAASKANKWQGRNTMRWKNDEFDRAFRAADIELDPVKRAALFIRMNDIAVQDRAVLPLMSRPSVQAVNHKLRAQPSGWDNDFWSLADWYREA